MLFDSWVIRDFKAIVQFCKTAQAFQDSPVSFPFTYVVLDHSFPGSKFILTVRDDDSQWYRSITRFHSKLWGDGQGTPPNKEQVRPCEVNQALFNTPEDEPYREDILKSVYNLHNSGVIEYFRYRPDDLLVVNVAENGTYKKLTDFLEVEGVSEQFPWENRT